MLSLYFPYWSLPAYKHRFPPPLLYSMNYTISVFSCGCSGLSAFMKLGKNPFLTQENVLYSGWNMNRCFFSRSLSSSKSIGPNQLIFPLLTLQLALEVNSLNFISHAVIVHLWVHRWLWRHTCSCNQWKLHGCLPHFLSSDVLRGVLLHKHY